MGRTYLHWAYMFSPERGGFATGDDERPYVPYLGEGDDEPLQHPLQIGDNLGPIGGEYYIFPKKARAMLAHGDLANWERYAHFPRPIKGTACATCQGSVIGPMTHHGDDYECTACGERGAASAEIAVQLTLPSSASSDKPRARRKAKRGRGRR